MLTAEATLLSRGKFCAARDLREHDELTVGVGWGETAEAAIKHAFVQCDYKGPILSLATSRGSRLMCTPDHLCCARINNALRIYHLYLMERDSMGFRVGLSNDLLKELLSMQKAHLEGRRNQETVDKVWIVESTENAAKAQFLLNYVMFKYGLPNVPFETSRQWNELSDEMIIELYNRIDTPSRAHRLLRDWLMYENNPHIVIRMLKAGQTASNAVQFILFGGNDKAQSRKGYAHLIRIDNVENTERAEHKQFKKRRTSHGQWYLEVTREDDEEAHLFVKTLAALDNLEIVRKIQLTKKAPFYLLPASHLKLGMIVPVIGDRGLIEEDHVVSIETLDYTGTLYDFKLEHGCTYIVGGWAVMAWPENENIAEQAPKSDDEL